MLWRDMKGRAVRGPVSTIDRGTSTWPTPREPRWLVAHASHVVILFSFLASTMTLLHVLLVSMHCRSYPKYISDRSEVRVLWSITRKTA
ncbi:hypothetical protein M758_10G142400 [Ceratodon purpureus]|nr:hypothetical protein M758_10G142400 [Ceratodon purpureus]